MREVLKVQANFREQVNQARGMLPIIEGDKFMELYEASTAQDKKELDGIFLKLDREGLKDWMAVHPSLDLKEWSGERLKELAFQLGVRNYSRLRKDELADEIKRIRRVKSDKRRHASGDRGTSPEDVTGSPETKGAE